MKRSDMATFALFKTQNIPNAAMLSTTNIKGALVSIVILLELLFRMCVCIDIGRNRPVLFNNQL